MYKQKMKNIIKKIALTIIYILLLTSFILGLIFIPKVYKLYKFSKKYINKPFSKEELQKNESRVLEIIFCLQIFFQNTADFIKKLNIPICLKI